MSILNVKDGIVLGLFGNLGEIEIERLRIFAVKHHEANGIASHFVDDIPQGYEFSCPF